MFDVINKYHEQIGHAKRLALYDAIKQEYANITLNCVLLYMSSCGDCYGTTGSGGGTANQRKTGGGDGRGAVAAKQTAPMGQEQSLLQQQQGRSSLFSDFVNGGQDEIDYSAHFIIGEDEIHCRHCNFVYFHKSRQRPRHSLRSHLQNYHRKLYNQIGGSPVSRGLAGVSSGRYGTGTQRNDWNSTCKPEETMAKTTTTAI